LLFHFYLFFKILFDQISELKKGYGYSRIPGLTELTEAETFSKSGFSIVSLKASYPVSAMNENVWEDA